MWGVLLFVSSFFHLSFFPKSIWITVSEYNTDHFIGFFQDRYPVSIMDVYGVFYSAKTSRHLIQSCTIDEHSSTSWRPPSIYYSSVVEGPCRPCVCMNPAISELYKCWLPFCGVFLCTSKAQVCSHLTNVGYSLKDLQFVCILLALLSCWLSPFSWSDPLVVGHTILRRPNPQA